MDRPTNGKRRTDDTHNVDGPGSSKCRDKGNLYMESKEIVTKERKSWFVLRHPKPKLIDEIFSSKKKVSLTADELCSPLPQFEYFIPFCDIQYRPSLTPSAVPGRDGKYEPRLDGTALRNDLRSFVFVYGEDSLIDRILGLSWNRSLQVPIRVMQDTNGLRIKVSDFQMNLFRNAIRQMDFQVCQGNLFTADIRQGDEVVVVEGPMKGAEGVVAEFRECKGHITLTIVFDMFSNTLQIAVPGFKIQEVQLRNEDTSRLMKTPVLSNFENELIELLCHRHGEHGTAALSRADSKRLRFLSKYADIVFEDAEESAKFCALMLICSYLKNDSEELKQRINQVEHLLEGIVEPVTDLHCYLMTALFIVTHHAVLRKRAKTYRQSHPDCPLVIRRFQSIAKKIKCR